MDRIKKIWITLVLLVFVSSSNTYGFRLDTVSNKRSEVVAYAKLFLGVREATGNNDGPEVEAFLEITGFGPGYAWCAAYMAYVYNNCSIEAPKSAWSPTWSNAGSVVWKSGEMPSKARRLVRQADHFTIYYKSKQRVGHVGMIVKPGLSMTTIEGNTNKAGSREGDGVYIKIRPLSQIYRINTLFNDH